MKLPLSFRLVLCILLGVPLDAEVAPENYRRWSSQSGHSVNATLVKVVDDEVTLKRKDGQVIHLPVDVLIYSDQAYLRESNLSKQVEPNSLVGNGAESRYGGLVDLQDEARQARRIAGLRSMGICIIKDYKIHGIGYASVEKEELGQMGLRELQIPIASCTKSINATLAAICVSRGKLQWDSTIADVFPELSETMDRRYREVTLEQLLNHTAGAPAMDAFWKSKDYLTLDKFTGSAREQRYELLKVVTSDRPDFKPGREFEYSNAGHYMAGSMLERVMDQDWEVLVDELILKPLGMNHTLTMRAVNPQLTAPGGGVSTTLEDFAKFCIFHLRFDADNALGIQRQDFERMHQASEVYPYGLGFFVILTEWSRGQVLQHVGKNQRCTSTFWLAPDEGFGVFAFTLGQHADSDFWNEAIPFLINEFKL